MTESDAILDLLKEHAPGLAEWLEARLEWMALAAPHVELAGEDIGKDELLTRRDGYLILWRPPMARGLIAGRAILPSRKHAKVYLGRDPDTSDYFLVDDPRGWSMFRPAFDAWADTSNADPIGDMRRMQQRIREGTIGPR